MYKDKVLLITGGTGSFGNALIHRFLDTDIKEIRVFSRDEKKQEDMRKDYNTDKLKFYIGDVRDYASIKEPVQGADYIFHAAALKQVPSCEFYPLEAIKTNILGTENVLDCAIDAGVKKVICLSTDKAAYPINAMGISKAMMEKVFIAKSRKTDPKNTIICGTRYGNVMCSRSSVIPLFIEQIKKGQPLTMTNPEMTRYMQTLEEAVELVLFAIEHAKTGDIMVKKAPACTIGMLAQALLELFDANNGITIIGSRHGEKLYETLLTREEMMFAEDMGSFYKVTADDRDLNYEKYAGQALLDKSITTVEDFNSHNTELLSLDEVKEKLVETEYVKKELASFKDGK
ncbi:MAG: UDP-glucose 4-epimerase [Clostridiales bacterium 43-6]|nr:MAG: UDP-glucose 4-epimerase [Clostridiales bacterium 43-6]